MEMKVPRHKKGERRIATGKSSAILDCSVAEVAAYLMAFCSCGRMRTAKEQGNQPVRLISSYRSMFDQTHAAVKTLPWPLHNRAFATRVVTQAPAADGSLVVAAANSDEVIDYGIPTKGVIKGSADTLYLLTPIVDKGSKIDKCEVTLYQKLDAGGRVPARLMNSKMPIALGIVCDLRQKFQKDDLLDAEERDKLAAIMSRDDRDNATSGGGEEAHVARVSRKFADIEDLGGLKLLDSPDMFVKAEAVFEQGSPHVVGKAETIVDAAYTTTAAWDFFPGSRHRSAAGFSNGEFERSSLKRNSHALLNTNLL